MLTAWRHTREYGGHLAAVMVMHVIGNRVRAGWGNWLDVLDGIPKFAATTEMPTGTPQIWDPAFVRLLHEVEGAYDGSGTDLTKGALYWADTRHIETPFFKDKILAQPESHPRIADLNTLTFWR